MTITLVEKIRISPKEAALLQYLSRVRDQFDIIDFYKGRFPDATYKSILRKGLVEEYLGYIYRSNKGDRVMALVDKEMEN